MKTPTLIVLFSILLFALSPAQSAPASVAAAQSAPAVQSAPEAQSAPVPASAPQTILEYSPPPAQYARAKAYSHCPLFPFLHR